MSMGNELFCLKGFYRKDTNVIKLRETYRQVSTNLTNTQRYNQFGKFGANSQFKGFDAIYLFAPIDTLGVLNLQMEGKDYKITQVLDATFKQLDSGYVKTTLGNLPMTTTWQQDFMLKPVALKKSIFNCQCPTENLFPIYQKLFPEDAKKRHGRMPK